MEASVYAQEAMIEATHWWFVGRRKLFAAEIARAGVSNDARVLDIGTSTGTNLRMLRDLSYRQVAGLDSSQDAIRFCEEKGLGPVYRGDVCAMPFADESFDLVLATDIVEHVDDDIRAVQEIARVLAPGGTVLITVPAFKSLWGFRTRLRSTSAVTHRKCSPKLSPAPHCKPRGATTSTICCLHRYGWRAN